MPSPHPRFRPVFALAIAAALIAADAAMAQSPAGAAAPASAPSPFMGQWELDLTRMPDTYGPPPRRVTYTFADAGSGRWRTEIAITAPDESVRRIGLTYRRDGRMVAGDGDTIDGDSAAVNAPAPNVIVMSIAKDRHLGSVRVYAVSSNGREMTESAANVDATGAPFVRNFHYRRIR